MNDTALPADKDALLDRLEALLPEVALLRGSAVSERYLHDWSREASGTPLAVVRPDSSKQLGQVLALCNELRQPVVVQGGMTGLCGGANPRQGELVISLERLRGIEELDQQSMTMTVKAGTLLEEIQQAAEAAGFMFPLDLGARGSCQIGGNIATNAGGNQVLRFGMTRNLVLGLEAVLADGTTLSSMNKMLKNNAGYDLKHLFIGTEGTLGVVTRAVLRLYPAPRSRCSALLALERFEDVVTLLRGLSRDLGPALSAYEVMWASFHDFIIDHVAQAKSPFEQRYPLYVLVEMEGADPERDQALFENVLGAAMEAGLVVDGAIASSEREREGFWQIRDGVGDIGGFIRNSANFDVSVPISSMQDFVTALDQKFATELPDSTRLLFGHIADSNLHLICSSESEEQLAQIYELMYSTVGRYQGSVSAEHGIGIQKLDYIAHSRQPQELAMMTSLKQALDPRGILNPGRVIPA